MGAGETPDSVIFILQSEFQIFKKIIKMYCFKISDNLAIYIIPETRRI